MREFRGKGAFITGGASGVGFALALAFGRTKMRVMLADIEVGALNAALAELKSEGIDAHGIECDVADRASVQHAAKETFAALDRLPASHLQQRGRRLRRASGTNHPW